MLTISGVRKLEKEEKDEKYHRTDSGFGRFLRSSTLPPAVLPGKASAEFPDVMLNVHLPKDMSAEVESVEIKVG